MSFFLFVCFLEKMRVFHIAKRYRPHHHWEPIYIGTNKEPIYDERLSWEGQSDKMTQVSLKTQQILRW